MARYSFRLPIALGLIAALALAAGGLFLLNDSQGADSGPSASKTPLSTAAVSDAAMLPTPDLPIAGWPITWAESDSTLPEIGPDGVLHINGLHVDASGHLAKSWQPLPQPRSCVPMVPGEPHGPCLGGDYYRAYYRLDGATEYRFWFDEADQEWTVEDVGAGGIALSSGAWESLTVGVDGTAIAWRGVTVGEDAAVRVSQTKLAVIGRDGRPLAGWPLTFAGAVSEPAIGADGTAYVSLAAYGTQTARVLALGRDGKPRPGWPFVLPSGFIPRLDGSGAPGEPFYPVAPILGRDGSVFVVADELAGSGWPLQVKSERIFSVTPSGQLRPGWPANLPGMIGQMQVNPCFDWCGPSFLRPLVTPPGAGSVELYVHAGGKLLALDAEGRMPAGWPKEIAQPEIDQPPFFGWLWWAVLPDGDLAAVEVHAPDDVPAECRLWRWNSDGSLSR